MATSQEGGPPPKSQAEVNLQQLLDRQLSTTGRLELVDFKEATESMRCIGHASGGVASLAQFQDHAEKQRQADEKAWALRDLLQSKGLSEAEIKDHIQWIGGAENATSPLGTADEAVQKRRRYGAHPSFLQGVESEQQQLVNIYRGSDTGMENEGQKHGQQAMGPEASVSRRSGALPLEMIIMGGRKPLLKIDRGELFAGSTPQERARLTEEAGSRSVAEVFSSPAPPVLDMYTYLEQRRQESLSSSLEPPLSDKSESLVSDQMLEGERRNDVGMSVKEVPEEFIKRNRMSEEDIRGLAGGKFAKYSPGSPSNTLYIKNLMPDVSERDLIAIFSRFEKNREPKLLYRLMQRGRMKGQAFITFGDLQTAEDALNLASGYILKGKPMVIEFARGAKPPVSVPVDSSAIVSIRSRRRKATKEKHAS